MVDQFKKVTKHTEPGVYVDNDETRVERVAEEQKRIISGAKPGEEVTISTNMETGKTTTKSNLDQNQNK
jgi:hypothetical protein